MSNFSVGDRVRIGPGNGGYSKDKLAGLLPGNTGVIVRIVGRGFDVRTDNAKFPTDMEGVGWHFFHDEIEPVEAT